MCCTVHVRSAVRNSFRTWACVSWTICFYWICTLFSILFYSKRRWISCHVPSPGMIWTSATEAYKNAGFYPFFLSTNPLFRWRFDALSMVLTCIFSLFFVGWCSNVGAFLHTLIDVLKKSPSLTQSTHAKKCAQGTANTQRKKWIWTIVFKKLSEKHVLTTFSKINQIEI